MVFANRVTQLLSVTLLLLATGNVRAQKFDELFGTSRDKPSPKAKVDVTLSPGTAKPGEEVTLTITAEVPEGFHIYSMTQKAQGALPTVVKFSRLVGVQPVDSTFTPSKPPKIVPGVLEEFPDQEEYHGKITWTQKYRLKPDANPADVLLAGKLEYSICTDPGEDGVGLCSKGEHAFEVALAQGDEEPAPAEQAPPPPRQAVDPSPALPPDQGPPPPAAGRAEVADEAASGTYEHRVGPQTAVRWKASLTPRQAAPGETVTLSLDADVQSGWHLYSPNQKQPDGQGPMPMVVQFQAGTLEALTPFIGPKPHEQKPVVEDWVAAGVVETYHEGKVRWSRTFEVSVDAKPGDLPISGVISYQVCQDSRCVAHAIQLEGMLAIGPKSITDPVSLTIAKIGLGAASDRITQADPVQEGDVQVAAAAAGGSEVVAAVVDPRKQGLFMFLVTAAVAGFVALLTPCVFPMVPITVSVFHKQAEKQHTNSVLMAAVYALSIIGTFTVLGLAISITFGAAALNSLANNAWLNVAIAAILIFFACNMLGMYDIVMPSWVLNMTAGQQSRGGYIGVIFMGLTFTLTSFTCTFAFAGALLTMAAAGDWLWPVFGMLAFSTAFALPFFLLALFPSALSRLPKSGGWMNTIKVVMGLLELGAVFKFLSVADITWNGRAAVFDFELVVSAWMVLAVVTGVYLLGLFRTPHDMPVEYVGVPRLILAMSFLGLAGYLGVGLFAAEKPGGVLWTQIVAFAPPRVEGVSVDDNLGPTMKEKGLTYALDPDKALAYAVKHKKPLFVDITGMNCANCRLMEQGPLATPAVHDRLKDFVLVRVYTDSVPLDDFAEARRLKRRNLDIQEWFGDVSLPSYLVIAPEPAAFEKKTSILNTFIGYNPNSELFAQFLSTGLERAKSGQVAQVQGGPSIADEGLATAEDGNQKEQHAVFADQR